MGFKEVKAEELNINPFTLIGKEWLLITAGTENAFNTMTASWGGLGVFWNKNAATIYVRPTRYTRKFVDDNDTFTISFYKEEYRKALALCGKVSGRDVNKVEQAGLTPVFEDNATYFEEAHMVMICKKMYHTNIDPKTFDEAKYDELMYPLKDYHGLFIGEIVKVLVKE
jgi:flavin reductase (DIM6/NTAB) family NADH-FMN oxidoreductase RutF